MISLVMLQDGRQRKKVRPEIPLSNAMGAVLLLQLLFFFDHKSFINSVLSFQHHRPPTNALIK